MPPKKKTFNAFSMYMAERQQELAKKGIKMSMADMPGFCKKDWEEMPPEIKESYKTKGKKMKKEVNVVKYTSIGERVEDVKQQARDNKSQSDAMYLYIEELVRVHPVSHYLSKQKFILIHVNPYVCENEGFYFPAEVSLAEFSLQKGLIRICHEMVGFDKVLTGAPPAPTADINMHAKHYHLITTFSKLSLNYKALLLKIIGFIMEKDVDETVLSDSTLDLPPIYTAHSFVGNELMVVTSSLYQLYKCVVKDANKEDFDCFIRVYHLDKLFMEMKNLSYKTKNPSSTEKALPSVAMATDALAKDMFSTIRVVGCKFHEELDFAHVCSNYYVCKWIYIFSTHCCQFFNIKLIHGCHHDFDLSTTTSTITYETPLEKMVEDLNISKKFSYLKCASIDNACDLATSSFPSLESLGAASIPAQRSVWNKPPSKVIPKMSALDTTTSNKDDMFPPLSGLQNVVPENNPANAQPIMNSWSKNLNLGRAQVLNTRSQLNKSPKKFPKGRGFNLNDK